MKFRRKPVQHVVMASGGAGSWATAKWVVENHGTQNLVLLFADTLMEDEDLYRFLRDMEHNIGVPITRIVEGRDPWTVFRDKRFLGNSRIDPCSYFLKRKFLLKWLNEHCHPASTVVYLGIDWTEAHRFEKARRYWAESGWLVQAPLTNKLLLDKGQILEWLKTEGIQQPRLYDMGFAHNNCGGFCIKAGQAHFKRLLREMPDRFAIHEAKEQELRRYLDKDVAIMVKTRDGVKRPYTLTNLREDVEAENAIDEQDWGGCSCFTPENDDSIIEELS